MNEAPHLQLCNGEKITLIDLNIPLYQFTFQDQVFDLRYQEDHGFVIENQNIYMKSMEESFKDPDIKKVDITLRMIDRIDNDNIFEYYGLKIGNINTRYYSYLNEDKKRIYTKEPESIEYLLLYKNHYSILTYCRGSKFSIHISSMV